MSSDGWKVLITILYCLGSSAVAFSLWLIPLGEKVAEGRWREPEWDAAEAALQTVMDEEVEAIAKGEHEFEKSRVKAREVLQSVVEHSQYLVNQWQFKKSKRLRGPIGALGILIDLAATLIWLWAL